MKKMLLLMGLWVMIGLELFYIQNKAVSSLSEDLGIDQFTMYMELFDSIFEELQCFPVVKELSMKDYPVEFENSWGAERTYGGKRTHEGCDLMAIEQDRGKLKVCSMTDGKVRSIGWLDQGGWRIGIESDSGVYYYYAHLDSYEKAFEKGERVVAGQILGRMGDSGYGKEPGTRGKFPIHLHVGIYVKDSRGKERAVNPYWYLKQLEI